MIVFFLLFLWYAIYDNIEEKNMIFNTVIELVKRLYATIKLAWVALFNLRNNPKKEEHSEERNNPEKVKGAKIIQRAFRRYLKRIKSIKETVTWYHGTNSHALIQMLASDKRLWSTGSLLKQGRYPLTGELALGVGVFELKGINCLGNISGSQSLGLPWRYTGMRPQSESLKQEGFHESLANSYKYLVQSLDFPGMSQKLSFKSILWYRFAHRFTVSRY